LIKHAELTERERMIVRYVVQGLKNGEISKILNISVHTTKAHLGAVYEKLGVQNRVQCAIKAIEIGLVRIKDVSNYE